MGEGAGTVLKLKYDFGTSMLYVIMQFTRACVSTIDDPVEHRIITNITHSMVQILDNCIVALDTKFSYARYTCTIARISVDIITCILD